MELLRKLLIPGGFLAIIFASLFITTRFGFHSDKATITIEVAPKSASIKIDGKTASSGDSTVTAGTHTVTVSKNGFSEYLRLVTIKGGGTAYIGAALVPNTEKTANWYLKNNADQKQAEVISGRASDFNSSKETQENPLLQLLPVNYGDGQGGMISISNGVPVEGTDTPAIYINALSPSSRQDALAWIRNRNFDPAIMDIVFPLQTNAFMPIEGYR